jgi:ribonuclease Z
VNTFLRLLRATALLLFGVLTAAAQPAGASDPHLQVTLLGTGNPRPSLDRFGPATLIEAGNQRVLLDVGRGASQRLFEVGQRDALTSIDLVVFSHLHSDHVVGFPDLWLTAWVFGRARPWTIVGPPGTADMSRHLEAAYAADVGIRSKDEGFPLAGVTLEARDVAPGVVYEREGLKITAFLVDHGPEAKPAYGYRFDYAGRSAVFSGDTRVFEPLVEHAAGADVLVHEVVSPEVEMRRAQVQGARALERIVARHTSPEQAGELFARIKPRLAVFSHIVPSPTTAEDLIGPTRRTYSGPLSIGYDLMTIRIGDTVDVFPRPVISDK